MPFAVQMSLKNRASLLRSRGGKPRRGRPYSPLFTLRNILASSLEKVSFVSALAEQYSQPAAAVFGSSSRDMAISDLVPLT